jgi:hypothetical protein
LGIFFSIEVNALFESEPEADGVEDDGDPSTEGGAGRSIACDSMSGIKGADTLDPKGRQLRQNSQGRNVGTVERTRLLLMRTVFEPQKEYRRRREI